MTSLALKRKPLPSIFDLPSPKGNSQCKTFLGVVKPAGSADKDMSQ